MNTIIWKPIQTGTLGIGSHAPHVRLATQRTHREKLVKERYDNSGNVVEVLDLGFVGEPVDRPSFQRAR